MQRMLAVFFTIVGGVMACASTAQSTAPVQAEHPITSVVFVCEHGNVKSLIAASLFNRVAEDRALPVRAESRGVNPEPGIPESVATALQNEGVDLQDFHSQQLTHADFGVATHVVAIGVDLSSFTEKSPASVDYWSDVPPASVDYEASRAALLRHINELLDRLQRDR